MAEIFARFGDDIAAAIVEPIAGNMGCIPPEPGFLESLRKTTADAGSLLVFDEVMTGFRVHRGGAQALYGIEPDLTTLGKVIGGGLPVGAFGGKAEIMDRIAPVGDVYQAGRCPAIRWRCAPVWRCSTPWTTPSTRARRRHATIDGRHPRRRRAPRRAPRPQRGVRHVQPSSSPTPR